MPGILNKKRNIDQSSNSDYINILVANLSNNLD